MISRFLVRTNYLKCYSLRLLIGHLLVTLPALCVGIGICLRKTVDFIWIPLLSGVIGWVLILPLTYTIPRSSKERVAIDALSGGFMAMLYLCLVMASFKDTCTKDTVEPKATQTLTQITEKDDSTGNNSAEKLWGHPK